MSKTDRFPELLAKAAEKVRGKDDPCYAALRNVLWEECPCRLSPLRGRLPYEKFSPVCQTCYLQGRHDKECDCGRTGYIPRRVWEKLREQGIRGALAGAVATIEEDGIGYVVELDVFDSDDADIAALEALEKMPNGA